MSPRLALGPVLYHWPAERLRDFYFRVADEAPVDIVYLGEVVCAKRAPFFAPYRDAVAGRLARAGKEVVRSTLALVMDDRELDDLRAARAPEAAMPVEVNDGAGVGLMRGWPHVVGPFVSVYNEATLAVLAAGDAVRVCLPAELSAASIAVLARTGAAEIEVQVFGRLPLAISARCYHARARGLSRDGCRFVCGADADGMAVATLDGEPIFAVNGPQTLSSAYCSLLAELGDLRRMGVAVYRLWPHARDMVAVARLFRDVVDGRVDAAVAQARLADVAAPAVFANGFYHARQGAAAIAE